MTVSNKTESRKLSKVNLIKSKQESSIYELSPKKKILKKHQNLTQEVMTKPPPKMGSVLKKDEECDTILEVKSKETTPSKKYAVKMF